MLGMFQPDLITSFTCGGAASLLGLALMAAVQAEQARIQYALTLFRWGFLFIASMLMVAFAPPDRLSVIFQAVYGCVGVGVVMVGWGTRQLQGRRTPPWLGWSTAALVAALLWVTAWLASPEVYLQVLNLVFLVLILALFLDQLWLVIRSAQASYHDWCLVVLVGGYLVNWLVLVWYGYVYPGPYPTHWVHSPAWWLPIGAISYALLPLCVATVVFAIINERLALQLRTRALSDELTGALSRRGLRELGERLLMKPRRNMPYLGVLIMDVDHFKRVNDTYGHLVGDDVLKHIAAVMQDRLRDGALLARYGGEEFVVLLPIRQSHEAVIVAERLRQAVELSPAQSTAGLIKVTVSIGVAIHRPELTLEQTLAAADACLYEAKQAGRNRVMMASVDEGAPTEPPSDAFPN